MLEGDILIPFVIPINVLGKDHVISGSCPVEIEMKKFLHVSSSSHRLAVPNNYLEMKTRNSLFWGTKLSCFQGFGVH